MSYRDYRLVAETELDYIEKGFNVALERWMSNWCGNNGFDINLYAEPIQNSEQLLSNCDSSWLVSEFNGMYSIGLHWSSLFPDAISNSFVGLNAIKISKSNKESVISKKLFNSSMTSLLETIVNEFTNKIPVITTSDTNSSDFFSEVCKPGAGYVALVLCFDSNSYLVVLINVSSILGENFVDSNNIQLSAAINAFGDSKIHLDVKLGNTELDIESITGLSVGDVITLDKSLNEKLSVLVDGVEICDAYIGLHEGQLSIKIDKPGLI